MVEWLSGEVVEWVHWVSGYQVLVIGYLGIRKWSFLELRADFPLENERVRAGKLVLVE